MSGVYKYTTKAGDRWRIGPAVVDPDTGETRRRQTQRRGFTREKDAKRALRDVLGDVDDGSYIDSDRITLAAYLTNEWLPSIKPRSADAARRHRGTVSVATHALYSGDVRRYVVPHLGTARLQSLAPPIWMVCTTTSNATVGRTAAHYRRSRSCESRGCSIRRYPMPSRSTAGSSTTPPTPCRRRRPT